MIELGVRYVMMFSTLALVGCTPRGAGQVTTFMHANRAYLALPRGPERVDALWEHARVVAGSDEAALCLLGRIAVQDGIQLKHPFNTGLTTDGPLSPKDKTGHFFTHAFWHDEDRGRLIPWAPIGGIAWEVLGEIRSWFTAGAGYDRTDLWANRLGSVFADRLGAAGGDGSIRPSEVISQADALRPRPSTSPATR